MTQPNKPNDPLMSALKDLAFVLRMARQLSAQIRQDSQKAELDRRRLTEANEGITLTA